MYFIVTATYNQALKYHKKEKKEGCFPNLQTLKQKTVVRKITNVKAKLLWVGWGRRQSTLVTGKVNFDNVDIKLKRKRNRVLKIKTPLGKKLYPLVP